jgi:hypothetical protein
MHVVRVGVMKANYSTGSNSGGCASRNRSCVSCESCYVAVAEVVEAWS